MSSKLENNKLTLGNVEITSDLLIPSFTFQSVNVTNTSTSAHLNIDEGYEYIVFKDGNIADINISEDVTLEVGKYVIVGVKGSIIKYNIITSNFLNSTSYKKLLFPNKFINTVKFSKLPFQNKHINNAVFKEV